MSETQKVSVIFAAIGLPELVICAYIYQTAEGFLSVLPSLFMALCYLVLLVMLVLFRKGFFDKYCHETLPSEEIKLINNDPLKQKLLAVFAFLVLPYAAIVFYIVELRESWRRKKEFIIQNLLGDDI